jgi:hypothetical protein
MADQNLFTIFLVVTAVAIFIQTGILAGFYFMSAKLSKQIDHALDVTRGVVGPMQSTADNLRVVTGRIAELSATVQEQLRQLERRWGRGAA